jgi:hypothetical protein
MISRMDVPRGTPAGSGKQRGTGRDEDLVVDLRAVEMRVRSHEDRVADRDREVGSAAQQRLLHHQHVRSEGHRTSVAVEHGAMQYA